MRNDCPGTRHRPLGIGNSFQHLSGPCRACTLYHSTPRSHLSNIPQRLGGEGRDAGSMLWKTSVRMRNNRQRVNFQCPEIICPAFTVLVFYFTVPPSPSQLFFIDISLLSFFPSLYICCNLPWWFLAWSLNLRALVWLLMQLYQPTSLCDIIGWYCTRQMLTHALEARFCNKVLY